MKKSVIILIAILFLVILAGTVFFLTNDSDIRPLVSISPSIEIEATVLSTSLEGPDNYQENGEIFTLPRDSATVRIESLSNPGGSSFDWSSIGIIVGEETELNFEYSVRPTKIMTRVGETTVYKDTVSHEIIPRTVTFKDGHFIVIENGNSETETILPGLEEGTRFKATLSEVFGSIKVRKYEIIS